MALITRCPLCSTRFKVVPDQLRISDGWVRCGQCEEVFDASAELYQSEVEPVVGSPVVPALPAVPAVPVAPVMPVAAAFAPLPSTPPLQVDIPLTAPEESRDVDVPSHRPPAAWSNFEVQPSALPGENLVAPSSWAAEAFPVQASLGEPAHDEAYGRPEARTQPWDPVFDPDADALPDDTEVEEVRASVESKVDGVTEAMDHAGPEEVDDPSDTVAPSLTAFAADMSTLPEETSYVAPLPPEEAEAALAPRQEVSFLNNAAPSAAATRWQGPARRRGLVALLVVLGLALAGQLLLQQRDTVAAKWPQTVSVLQALCSPFGCTVQPLRQIDAIVIDSSTFTTLRHGVYRLNVVLKNRGAAPLAVPAIELALTDTQEQPVLRRVLQAGELLPAPTGHIAPGAEWVASTDLAVSDEASIGRIVGYRLLAFYP